MKITKFEVQGYKNLVAPCCLDELGDINVLHGPNDVGKSNLLEALELAFRLLGAGDFLPFTSPRTLSDEAFAKLTGRPLRYAFNLDEPAPIRLRIDLSILPLELARVGIQQLLPCDHVSISQTLEHDQAGKAQWKIQEFRFSNGRDAAVPSGKDIDEWALKFALFLARHHLVGGKEGRARCQLVPAHRIPGLTATARAVEDSSLALDLYDARESPEPLLRGRWGLFREVVGRLIGLDSERAVSVRFDRHLNEAQLLVEGPQSILPLDLMGSGTQQIAGLVGHLLLSGASILAIEEPELNLRYERQEELRDALRHIVEDGRGPGQLFLSSHSPVFEFGPHFYSLEPGPKGPVVYRRPSETAATLLGWGRVPEVFDGSRAVQSYVSSEGVLKLPQSVMASLELPHGGGVVFELDEAGRTEILSNAKFIERYELPS